MKILTFSNDKEKFVNNKIIVLVPFRNASWYLMDCVNSIVSQLYSNYKVYLLDDGSEDNSIDLIEQNFEGVYLIRRQTRLGAMENVYRALTELPIGDDDIILLVDGDDFLIGEYVFKIVNEIYNSRILLTYGQYINNFGLIGIDSPYSTEEFNNLRKAPWKATHLKTFKYKLFKALLAQDPNAKSFKWDNDRFYTTTSDQAIMIPLMEIAGFENTSMISNIVYCYRIHSNNVHACSNNGALQREAELHIRNRQPLERVF
ncbi:glycosyltransferase [Niabella pedocola]|uniref:Glycosyltransferase n=1 Tax=Niabella pedocola TaxID=1752077 RepID=A0ABS8PTN2_9BACT|nr:glycosyltransferase [Niabella pedocola]MCD2424430.1 glycosyltransferase [Niabella pedocola]